MKMYEEFELDLTNEKEMVENNGRGWLSQTVSLLTAYSKKNCTNGCDDVIAPTHNKCNTVNTCRTTR